MTTSNSYVTNAEFQSWMFNSQSASSTESLMIDIAIDAASREIEEYTNRRFYADTVATPRVYTAQTWLYTFTDDISDTASIVVAIDANGDGVFEQVWAGGANSDYQTEPNNAIQRGRPITGLRAVGPKFFPVYENSGVWVGVTGQNRFFYAPGAVLPAFGIGQALVQVTAKWGWPVIPPPIKQATLIQAAMLYQSKNAPMGVVGMADLGAMRVPRGLHAQACNLADPYRLNAGGIIP